ncbi:MAG: hypothetical protein ACI32Q_01150 [Intestinibaculum porci]|uniref:hypothetical protein n=1 Tax=Intestinibaculum porci TaxID=2487118 RepID=UPI003F0209D0
MKKMMKVLSMLMLALLLSIGSLSAKTTASVYELNSLYTSRFTIKGSRLYVTTRHEPIKKLGKTRWDGTRLCGFKKTFKIGKGCKWGDASVPSNEKHLYEPGTFHKTSAKSVKKNINSYYKTFKNNRDEAEDAFSILLYTKNGKLTKVVTIFS